MADYDAKWFRSWHGAPTDAKWLVVAKRAQVAPGVVSAVFWALLDYASQSENRGSVDGFDIETYAAFTGWGESEITDVIAAMTSKGIITPDNRLAAWDKRQPKREDPSSTERQQRKRERDRVTPRDNSVIDGNVTRRHAASRDGTTDKIREDKIREEREEGLARPPASAPPLSQEPADPEWGAALSKLESLGMVTGSALLEFQALWPDLRNGRRDWLDDAIKVAHANGANSPVYAIRVLASSLRSGKQPVLPRSAEVRRTGRDLDALLGITTNGNT